MSTQTMGDVIINMRANDVSMKSGFDGVAKSMDRLSEKVLSFEGVLHIAFGAQAARAIFHAVHHGIIEAGEGFREATEYSLGFGESIENAFQKVFGLKTVVDGIKESEKLTAAAAKDHADAIERQVKLWRERRDIGEGAAKELGETRRNTEIGRGEELTDSGAKSAIAKYDAAIRKLADQIADEERQRKVAFAKLIGPGHLTSEETKKTIAEDQEALKKATEFRRTKLQLEKDRETAERIAFANQLEAERMAKIKEGVKQDEEQEKYWDEVTKYSLQQMKEQDKRNEEAQKKKDEEDKRHRDEAQRIIDASDPLARIKHQGEEAEALFRGGFLTKEQRDTEFKKLGSESLESKTSPMFMSLEQMARKAQESAGKPEELKPTLANILTTLQDIKNNPKLAVLN